MSARDDIFAALRFAGQNPSRSPALVAAEARALLADPQVARPVLPAATTVESFMTRVAGPKVAATVDRVAGFAGLPAAVARYLSDRGLPATIAVQPTPSLTRLDWAASGLAIGNAVNESVGVGLARWGVAETGSLVFHSAADMPILFNFLPAVHIVAVRASTILPYLEDYANAARAAGDPAPRNAGLVTGASGTADIEASLVKGAHGPRELHIVLVEDA